MTITRPAPAEYAAAFEHYLAKVSESEILPAFEAQAAILRARLGAVSEERSRFRYAPGKWSIREVVGHLTDSERVFGYRTLCVARGESVSLPGFEENDYAATAGHDGCTLGSILEEFETLRRSHVLLVRHLDDAAIARVGTANGHPASVRALLFIMVGHVRHHLGVLETRYGVGA